MHHPKTCTAAQFNTMHCNPCAWVPSGCCANPMLGITPTQFNPDYKSYVLHTDGGPSENVKRKKFRGKKKKKPAFTLGLGELGEFAHKIKMPKLKGLHARALGLTSEGTAGETSVDEEGGQWHSAVRRDNILTDMRDMTLRTVNQVRGVSLVMGGWWVAAMWRPQQMFTVIECLLVCTELQFSTLAHIALPSVLHLHLHTALAA